MPTVPASGHRAIFFVFYFPHLSAYFKESIMGTSGKELKIEKRPKNWEERREGTAQKEEMVERVEEGVSGPERRLQPVAEKPPDMVSPPLEQFEDLDSSRRPDTWPGACILDNLSFMPLRFPCNPQALQSLGRLSSWLASKDLSGASKGQNAT